jgi:1-acyl-sn-glycerol-3-phosphate acyltransferase
MRKWLVNSTIKVIVHLILKVNTGELDKFPMEGPLLVTANHINFLDVPVVISHLYPRPTSGLVKKETWDDPFLGFLFDTWDCIPIDRGVADFSAFKLAKKALEDKKILAFAPEGTRTEDGKLIRAKAGVGILATQSDCPILPVAHFGQENFSTNFRRLNRTKMTIRVGKPYKIVLGDKPRNKETMQDVADAVMLEIAEMLPATYRGYYQTPAFDWKTYVKPVAFSAGEHIPEAIG